MITLILVVAVIAAVSDYRTYRIPNWLTFGSILLGLTLNTFISGFTGLLVSLAGLIIGGFVLWPFFIVGGMGAGDVKLMAGFGAIGGPLFSMNVLLTGSIFGGLAALLILAKKYGCRELLARLFLLLKLKGVEEKSVLPYGVFLSAGAALSCFWGVF